MPYNILILPLCGGYFILLNFVYFKYRYQRLSSQRILFTSIIAGVFLIFFTFMLRWILFLCFPETMKDIFNSLNENIPVRHEEYLWTSIASFLIAVTITLLSNLIVYLNGGFSYEKLISYAVKKYGDEIENLFRISVETGELMQLTLKNNKVYIGFTDIIPVPKKTNYLKITPIMSGYRESESKILKITTEYFDVLTAFMSNDTKSDLIDIFIKQDEILIAGIYDHDVFNSFQEKVEKIEETMRNFPIVVILEDETEITDEENPLFKAILNYNHSRVSIAQAFLNRNLNQDEQGDIRIKEIDSKNKVYRVRAIYYIPNEKIQDF